VTAKRKQLRVVASQALGEATHALDIECTSGEPLQAMGGKYIILDTGLIVDDKPVKRSYTLVPLPGRAGQARMIIKRLGAGSQVLHRAAVGATFAFSGPWGKLTPEGGLAARTLVVATDTGITSALGLSEQRALDGATAELAVLWLRAADERFLDDADVAAQLARAGVSLHVAALPPVGDAARLPLAWHAIDEHARSHGATLVIATGDGAVVYPLRAALPGRVASVVEVRLECFFHNPERAAS
jgi:ferredoxin-NADP reductase